MFAIDCLKVNGTHLGTCIDRFYFGSCCLVEPIEEIVDNRIETELLDEREPPMRKTNTTSKPTTTTHKVDDTTVDSVTNKINNQSTTIQIGIIQKTAATTPKQPEGTTATPKTSEISTTSPTTSIAPVSSTIIFGQKLTSTTSRPSSESTTIPQKLQTFQVVAGITSADTTTSSSSLLTTTVKERPTITEIKTKGPTVTTTNKPSSSSSKPTPSKPAPTKATPSKTTTRRSSAKPKPTTKPSGK